MTEDERLLAELAGQEQRLQFDGFDDATAWELGLAFRIRALARELPIAIDVTRVNQQLFHSALPGASADNDAWIQRKNAVVYRFGHSSLYMGVQCRIRGVPFEEKYLVDPRIFAAHGGAFPVRVRGVGLVGTVTVSGLSQRADHDFVVEGLEAFLGDIGP
jgi:uncharacterized protein (UPF0303 family)